MQNKLNHFRWLILISNAAGISMRPDNNRKYFNISCGFYLMPSKQPLRFLIILNDIPFKFPEKFEQKKPKKDTRTHRERASNNEMCTTGVVSWWQTIWCHESWWTLFGCYINHPHAQCRIALNCFERDFHRNCWIKLSGSTIRLGGLVLCGIKTKKKSTEGKRTKITLMKKSRTIRTIVMLLVTVILAEMFRILLLYLDRLLF